MNMFSKKLYKNKKDFKYSKTIKKLSKIYKNLNIDLNITRTNNPKTNYTMPHSLHIYMDKYTDLGANGKGKSLPASFCSGIAELTERLQNGFIIDFVNNEFTYAPDEKKYDLNNIPDFTMEYIKEIFLGGNVSSLTTDMLQDIRNTQFLNKQNYLSSHIYDIPESKTDNFITVPFYSVFENKVVELPIGLIRAKNFSSGMCAGNTKEEALVQGISEILERYVTKQIYQHGYSLPVIPSHYYEKYTEIKDLITYITNIGKFKIKIFDASLGLGLPVIMVMFIDMETDKFTLSFGAHPDYIIALERTLTEFMQGFSILSFSQKQTREIYATVDTENPDEYYKIYINSVANLFFDCQHSLFSKLNKNNPDFQLNTAYLDRDLNMSNKQLLEELLIIIKKLKKQIYIRDVSFLGFNSFTVEIPTLSDIKVYDYEHIVDIKNQNKTSKFFNNEINSNDITLLEMKRALDSMYFNYYDKETYYIKNIPNLLLSSILKLETNDKDSAINDLAKVIKHRHENKYLDDINLILYLMLISENEYIGVKDSYLEPLILICKKIIKYPLKSFLEFVQVYMKDLNNSKSYNNQNKETYKNTVRKRLIYEYKKNLPKQEDCYKIFKDIRI